MELYGEYQVFEKAGKKGLKDQSGQVIIPATYESIGWSRGEVEVIKGVIGYKLNGLWGLLNINNEKITDAEFTELYDAGQQLLAAARRNTTTGRDYLGLITPTGEELLPFKYAHIEVTGLRAIVAKKVKNTYHYGVLNLKGNVIISPVYKNIEPLGGLRFTVKNFDNRTAVFDDHGNVVVDFLLDSISAFKGEYAIVYDNHRRGVISKNGILLIESNYQNIRITEEGIETRLFNEWDVMDAQNTLIKTFRVEKLKPFSENLFMASANNWAWLINNEGEQITPVNYNHIDSLAGNLAVFRKGGKWGVLNKQGQVKIPAGFDSVVIDQQMIFAKKKELWSLYDSFNIKKTSNFYQAIGRKTGRLFPVKKNNHWGFIDRVGEEVIHCVYEKVGKFKNGLVWVQFHGEKGVINRAGDWVVLPHKADKIEVLNNTYYISESKGLKRLKSFDGNIIYFTENPIAIRENYLLEYISDGGIWKIDFSGRIVEEARDQSYEEVRSPSEGFYAIKKDGSYGFIDAQNRLRIANRYEDVGPFNEGLAAFKLLGKWGFLNKKEEIVIQPTFHHVSHFYDNVAMAYDQAGAGLIDKSGKKISSFSYDSLSIQANGRFQVYKDGKVGLLSKEGRLMINAKYDVMGDLNNGFVIVGKSSNFGLVDLNGVNTIPMIYDELFYDKDRDVYLGMKKSTWVKVQLQ